MGVAVSPPRPRKVQGPDMQTTCLAARLHSMLAWE